MYILQALNESAVKYRLNTNQPRGFFRHLFFTNGNGIEFKDGNPVEYVKFGRTIPWEAFYKDVKPLPEMIEYFKEYHLEKEINENFRNAKKDNDWYKEKGYEDHIKDNDTLWEEVSSELEAEFDEISDITLDELKDIEGWYNYLKERDYFPHLGLSDGYFKLQQLNENTEINLLELAVNMLWGYGKFFEEFEIKGMDFLLNYESGFVATNEQRFETAMSDSKMIKKELIRLINIKDNLKDYGKDKYYKKGLYNEKIQE